MEKDIEIITSHFRKEAADIFLMIVEDCRQKTRRLNRQWDENVFQQQQGRYANELIKQLTHTAEKIIGEYKGKMDTNVLRREMTTQIDYYKSQFILKIRSM